jgi:hypothetical protein
MLVAVLHISQRSRQCGSSQPEPEISLPVYQKKKGTFCAKFSEDVEMCAQPERGICR